MCNVCWKEFKGWCKAFTKTEVFLVILEAVTLALFIVLLVLLVMHLITCGIITTDDIHTYNNTVPHVTTVSHVCPEHTDSHTTLDPHIKCTWEPSKKTAPGERYYENGSRITNAPHIVNTTISNVEVSTNSKQFMEVVQNLDPEDRLALDEQTDGEEADEDYKSAVLALVKLRPPTDITFGCILTVISEHWTVTAASCIEAIEEVDSLDNFVIMERYGTARSGLTHTVTDVQLHPMYQGANRSYDIAALRSEDNLQGSTKALTLPSLIDYFLITVGEKFTILGYGSFRSIDPPNAERPVRAIDVYTLPGALCREVDQMNEESWAPRHLSRGREQEHGAGGCGAAALCAGVRYARGTLCTYCGGTPLVRDGTLFGVMAEARACGQACEPAAYVNIALVADWIDLVLHPD